MTRTLRIALMGTVTSTALLALASPASAQSCTISPVANPTSDVTCAAGATANTTMTGAVSPTNDREYLVTTAGGNASATVSGALTGYGLAITNTAGGANTLTVTNNSGVTVDSGNLPTAGGSAAVDISAIGATNTVYTGSGAIANLGTGDALSVDTTGTGTIGITNSGALTSTTANGITVNSTGGATSVNNSGAIQANLTGILANNTGTGAINVTNSGAIGSLTATPGALDYGIYANSTGTGAVTVANTGAVGSSTDRLTLNGVSGLISNAGSSANLSVSNGAGAVYSGLIGVYAANAGTGTTSITTGTGAINAVNTGVGGGGTTGALTVNTGTGAITASDAAGTGLDLTQTTGGMTVTTAGAITGGSNGIRLNSTSGNQTLTVGGNVTGTATAGIHSDTTGSRTITINSGRTVTGGAEAILLTDTGTATITNNGTVGAASTGLALNGAAAGTTTFNNNASGTLNGRLTFGAGNDTLNNAGTFNTQGTTDFGAGSDTFNNTGTLNLTGATTFTGLETANLGGTTNLGGYTLTGTGALNNTGTLNSNGGSLLGFTSQSNSGTLNLSGITTVSAVPYNNSGTIRVTGLPATLTGQTTFNNTGTISMVDGAADDLFTINSSYNGGAGARLAVDANETMADMLVVTGAITGSTFVDANILGTGALIGGGVQVVDGQSTSTPDAFVLGNITGGSPLVAYNVEQASSDYYLTAALTPMGFEPLSIATAAVDLWYPSADEVIANLAVPYKGEGLGIWAQGYASRDKYGDSSLTQTVAGIDYDVNQRVKVGRLGIQGGVDFGVGSMGRVGVTGGFGTHRFKGLTELDADGWNLGAYGAFGGVTGFHGELLGKYDRYRVRFRDGPLDDMSTHVRSTGIDGSIGYRMPMGSAENASLDLAAGLSHVWNKIDTFDAYGLTYDYHGNDSTRGRASARWNIGGDIQPYVQGTVYHEFANAGGLTLNDGVNNFDLDGYGRGTWGRIEAGVGGSPSRFPSFGAWVDLGDVRGLGARLGFRFGGHAEPMAPPPPPVVEAPVEPAPATQTCYDGSVILATDTCPVPPPPPPPAAAPERG